LPAQQQYWQWHQQQNAVNSNNYFQDSSRIHPTSIQTDQVQFHVQTNPAQTQLAYEQTESQRSFLSSSSSFSMASSKPIIKNNPKIVIQDNDDDENDEVTRDYPRQ